MTSKRKEDVFRLLDQLTGTEQTEEGPVRALSIGDEFPDELWALFYPAEGKYYCVTTPPMCGEPGISTMVTTSSRELAEIFIEALSDEFSDGCVPKPLTFEEARLEAKARPAVEALSLVDEPDKIKLHFIR